MPKKIIKRVAAKRPAPLPKRRAAPLEAQPPPEPDAPSRVSLRYFENGALQEIPIADGGGSLSFFWSHVVRSRGRWRRDPQAQSDLIKEAKRRFHSLGLNEQHLISIARAGTIEVSISYTEENWAPRILPWEFLLSEMTRNFRSRHLVVIRHLDVPDKARRKPNSLVKDLLIVESNPAPFGDEFSFETEIDLVNHQLGLTSETISCPSRAKLEQSIKSSKPDVIHIAGIDTHHASDLIRKWGIEEQEEIQSEGTKKSHLDGLVMDDDHQKWTIVEASDLAKVLNSATVPPQLVSFNCYNSGARLAAMAVAHGANAAIGFYDDINDAVAERFFAIFYQLWRLHKWDLSAAFPLALKELRDTSSVEGAVIVLWSRESLIGKISADRAPITKETPAGDLRSRVFVSVMAPERVNYSRLHANEPLFSRFNI
jgi:hypothetical protein